MFEEGGNVCLVFELMRGGELLDKILRYLPEYHTKPFFRYVGSYG